MKLYLVPMILLALLVCPALLALEARPDAEPGLVQVGPVPGLSGVWVQFGPLAEPHGLQFGPLAEPHGLQFGPLAEPHGLI